MFEWLKKQERNGANHYTILADAQSLLEIMKKNEDLKRENRLLKQVNERHIETIKRLDNEADRFPKGGVVYAKPKGEMFIPFKMFKQEQHNLLEIKLKDTGSVPEVWYEGKRLDELPNGLVSIDYNWKTKGHDNCDDGENNLDVEWFGTHKEGFRR